MEEINARLQVVTVDVRPPMSLIEAFLVWDKSEDASPSAFYTFQWFRNWLAAPVFPYSPLPVTVAPAAARRIMHDFGVSLPDAYIGRRANINMVHVETLKRNVEDLKRFVDGAIKQVVSTTTDRCESVKTTLNKAYNELIALTKERDALLAIQASWIKTFDETGVAAKQMTTQYNQVVSERDALRTKVFGLEKLIADLEGRPSPPPPLPKEETTVAIVPLPPTPPPAPPSAPPVVTPVEMKKANSDLLKSIQQGKALKTVSSPPKTVVTQPSPAVDPAFAKKMASMRKSTSEDEDTESVDESEWTESRISCAMCFSAPLHTCSRCKKHRYCGKACQLAHWKSGHAEECIRK